jgi:5-(carboxyamino)imidazole ribonucleotide synthase
MDSPRVGIIGDGQLGWMLCRAAAGIDVQCTVLTGSAETPAAREAGDCVIGGMDDLDAVRQLIERCAIITYEREDIPSETLELLRTAEQNGDVACYPPLNNIELLQDKALQKQWLAREGLSTLPFVIVDEDQREVADAISRFGFPLVQKSLRGGFDGRGVQIINSSAQLGKLWPGRTMIEAHAGDFSEIGVMVCRARDGEIRCYAPTSMSFNKEYSVLEYILSPAHLSSDLANRATRLASSAVEALDGVGMFGVEMFLLSDGELLINEISGRVHNAGHVTMDACETSQFEQHLRAITGMPLGSVRQRLPVVMRNLLCQPSLEAAAREQPAGVIRHGDAAIYWYGKEPSRMMRKIGHINATGQTLDGAKKAADRAYRNLLSQDGGAA